MLERIIGTIWYGKPKWLGLHSLVMLLAPFSLVYGAVVMLRNRLFDHGFIKQEKLPVRVISIGNITVGGTGKTPMVIRLADMLKDHGFRPAVLSRGYGGKAKSPVNVVSKGSQVLMPHQDAGDEPVLIAKSLAEVPILTGPRRVVTGAWALQNLDVDVLILDDGMQHRRLFRDINIVLCNIVNPLGNEWVLPAGPLREPKTALKRADILIAVGTHDDIARRSFTIPLKIDAPLFKCYYRPRYFLYGSREEEFPLELVRGKKVLAFCGIGNPSAFLHTIRALGADIAVFMPFADHHRYRFRDASLISSKARLHGAQLIVTTEKDKVKIQEFDFMLSDVYALRVEMEFLEGQDDFMRLIIEKLKR